MNKILIVDTNIIFSGILNLESNIASILINHRVYFQFFAPDYLKEEILAHQERICELGKMDKSQFEGNYQLLIQPISFIKPESIPRVYFESAFKLCDGIDIDDVPFVALALHLNGELWTGDKQLSRGLTAKSWDRIVSTKQLLSEIKKF